jgi:hypothetical protein
MIYRLLTRSRIAICAGFILPLAFSGAALAQSQPARTSAYCDGYAKQTSGGGDVISGAARGAVGGAVVGGIVRGKNGARSGSKYGAAGGAISGAAQKNQRYKTLYSKCMNGDPL